DELADVTSPGSRPARELPAEPAFTELAWRLRGRAPALFLDFDGTLSPIVDRPDDAAMDEGLRETVRALAEVCRVVVISGRDRADVERRVDVPGLWYVGSHGFDIRAP